MESQLQPACRPGGRANDENCDPLDRRGAPGLALKPQSVALLAAAAGRQQHGDGLAAAQQHRSGMAQLQSALNAELEAAARDTMLAQCHALLSLEDTECLPHDPLFDMLPAAGASRRSPPKREQVVAALQAAAMEAAALVNASGAGLGADSSLLAATVLPSMAPPTCGRNKRAADAPAPATQLPARAPQQPQKQLPQGWGCTVPHLTPSAPVVAAEPARPPLVLLPGGTPAAATPAPITALAAGKRQRMLLLTAARGAAGTPGSGATPGSGVGSNSRVQPKAQRRVARDLSFTPAPPLRQLSAAGTPPTAGSASRCSGPMPEPLSRNAVTVQPFSLLRSPRTSTQLAELNARIQAAAAADLRFERRQGTAPSLPCGAAAAPQPAHRAVRSVRLC
ncbi:hypothetical protein C2E21_9108 [Chlorella sorokiniana]|uniref:Uncharacterized protein n=1 Tax=Chlorella sorokiniana TaxID=3076 RepID=A0A2P6TCQ2_CHLSO|nr:hypothetical protein C2E21_9108 [Chlorella sorokiniana]|eukprot:PRW20402.1 hypothetical protein C2E21_9108 [Chlorella sorokiniana]